MCWYDVMALELGEQELVSVPPDEELDARYRTLEAQTLLLQTAMARPLCTTLLKAATWMSSTC